MKNLLLFTAIALASPAIFAQSDLYVQPNGSNSSYVFVKDQIIYVEDDINLQANPTGDEEASIYLRDGAQLIQGASGAANSGNGSISIYQESYGDSWDYNFWCSPVGNINGTGNRSFGYVRLNDSIGGYGAGDSRNYTAANQAILTANLNGVETPLTISRRWFYRWNPTNQRWVGIGAGNNVAPGEGFIMKGVGTTNHTQRYDFRGRANNGDLTLTTQVGVPFTDGLTYNFTLAGNPYPSAINLYRVATDPDNTEIDSFRYWDEDITINSHNYIHNIGGYATWIPGPNENDPGTYTVATYLNYDNSGNPTGSSGFSGLSYERLNAPVGQGFMIVANAAGSITIKNSHRKYVKEGAANYSQFRNAESAGPSSGGVSTGDPSGIPADTKPQIRIHTYFGENSHFRDMVLLFNDESTDGYDRLKDARHPMDAAVAEAYFTIQGNSVEEKQNLVIQTVPYTGHDKLIPISFKLSQQMPFFVKGVEEINVPYGKVYLYDSLNQTYEEIGDGNQAFQTLPAGVYENRFFIAFRGDNPVGDDELAANDVPDGYAPTRDSEDTVTKEMILQNVNFFQNNTQKQLEVLNPEGYDIKTVNIFDMTGKLVINEANLGTNNRFSFPTHNLSEGVYLVKLTTVDDITADYKITVFNK